MAEHKRCENLEHAMCKELEKLDRKYSGDVEMTEQDAERARTLWHALKCAETYYAMVEAKEYDRGGMSERRYRMVSPEDGYSRHWDPRDPRDRIDPYRPW